VVGATGLSAAPARAFRLEDSAKVRLRILYALHAPVQDRPDWPNIGFDFRPVISQIENAIRQACPNFELLPAMADGPETTAKILQEDQANPVDGYLVCQMNCWNRVVQPVAELGKPTLYADFLFAGSGGFLVYTAQFLRRNVPNVGFVSSSRLEDLVEAVKCFEIVKKGGTAADFVAATAKLRRERTPGPGDMTCKPDQVQLLSPEECLRQLREIKLLAVGGGWPGIIEAVKNSLGITVLSLPFQELNEAYQQADKDAAREIARGWEQAAARIADVSPEVLEQSAAMYLAEKALLQKHGAQGISINCLGGFYGGHIHAYPCMGFFELNNSGLIGGCECDIRSAVTMLALTTMTQGRPGFISDPVIDTAKRQIIYAHCVASNKQFGPQGASNPFEILTHSEDRKGAAVRSIMPEGYMTTTLELAPEREQILFHQAKSVGNSFEDRACRTKLCGEPVGDIEKLFAEWDQWGWHRVTFYGDLKEPVFALADALGWTVIEEA